MVKILTFVLMTCFLFLSCVSSPDEAPDEVKNETESLSEGQRLEISGKLAEEARIKLDHNENVEGLDLANKALELDPTNCNALMQKGRAYMHFQKINNAITSFETALNHCHNQIHPLVSLARCYNESGKTEKSHEYLDKALEINPNDNMIYLEFGRLYLEKYNDPETALMYFYKSIEKGHKNDPWMYNDMSIAYEKLDNHEKAKEYIYKAKALIDDGIGDHWIKEQIEKKLKKYQ
jgi:tetratricopeptide (TPR) repeat protein